MPTLDRGGAVPLPGLSARLLLLTISFVMLAEVLIYAPSIARFRLVYLEERIMAAHLASLAVPISAEGEISPRLTSHLLHHAESHRIVIRGANGGGAIAGDTPLTIDAVYDLRKAAFFPLVWEAFKALGREGNRIIEVVAPCPKTPGALVKTAIEEAPLRSAMLDYSGRILVLSIIIALIAATLVFVSLRLLFVRPMLGITESMVAFRADPEGARRPVNPSRRTDEIGRARRELAEMQRTLRKALRQRSRLAALGTSAAKINHDLRNSLASAHLVSDRIRMSPDPGIRKIAPTLLGALDRASRLCTETVAFAHEGETPPAYSLFDLRALVDEVGEDLRDSRPETARFISHVPRDLPVEADPNQLRRVLTNLTLNAFQADARTVKIGAWPSGDSVRIAVTDDGLGLPQRVREHLFEPFSGSSRVGGTGLGLSIARDLMRAHGGNVRLVRTGDAGTVFEVELPSAAPPGN